ncbi:MAG: MerR family transcriptional regulator, partial [Limnobacter sp.]|nr:MerR family transcriptional regulator [Limnobacter sp.]
LKTREFTIDELARTANTTVRNVRAYQDRGLLEPPEKRGRVGFYNESHLTRLRLIGHLLSRGYTLANIQEMLDAIEKGYDLHQLLGLTHAITSPWTDEIPKNFNAVQLATLFGKNMSRAVLAKSIDLGLLEPDGLRYRAPSPKILYAGSEMAREGIPLLELLDLIASLRSHLEEFCDQAVSLFVKELDQYGDGLPPKEELPRLSKMVWKIRPLAMRAIESEVSRALQKSAGRFVDERIIGILDKMSTEVPGAIPINADSWAPPAFEVTQATEKKAPKKDDSSD